MSWVGLPAKCMIMNVWSHLEENNMRIISVKEKCLFITRLDNIKYYIDKQ